MSARAAMSTPCVGSMSTKISALARCQRAISAFCWLPPESVRIGTSIELATTPNCADLVGYGGALCGDIDEDAGAASCGERRKGDVLLERQVGKDALALALVGNEADARCNRVPRMTHGDASPRDTDGAAVGDEVATEHAGHLVLPRAEETGERHDLAGADGEAGVARREPARRAPRIRRGADRRLRQVFVRRARCGRPPSLR